jgi:hypothetical protein
MKIHMTVCYEAKHDNDLLNINNNKTCVNCLFILGPGYTRQLTTTDKHNYAHTYCLYSYASKCIHICVADDSYWLMIYINSEIYCGRYARQNTVMLINQWCAHANKP